MFCGFKSKLPRCRLICKHIILTKYAKSSFFGFVYFARLTSVFETPPKIDYLQQNNSQSLFLNAKPFEIITLRHNLFLFVWHFFTMSAKIVRLIFCLCHGSKLACRTFQQQLLLFVFESSSSSS
jgi:hypothetical protein